MVNWNWMLPGFVNYHEGVDGLKTGTTDLRVHAFRNDQQRWPTNHHSRFKCR